MHSVKDDFFQLAKERYTHVRDIDIDTRFIDIVRRFNNIDGVVSMWSCSGHTPEEIYVEMQKYEGDIVQPSFNSKSDIIFVVDEKSALNIITSLSKFVDSFTIEEFLLYRPSINLIQLLSPFKMKSDLLKYNAIQIKMNTQLSQGDFSVYDQWIKLLENFGV